MPLPRRPMHNPTLLAVVASILLATVNGGNDDGFCNAAVEGGSCQHADLTSWETPPPPKSCRLFLAPRPTTTKADAKGAAAAAATRKLGVFTAADWPRGMPLTPRGGDIVLHLIDIDPHLSLDEPGESSSSSNSQLGKWLANGYLQDAITSGHGGNYEGLGKVVTALPGIGMMAATAASPPQTNRPNVWASVPEMDEANIPRYQSPLAGSFSLHYNLTYLVTHPEGIQRGGEVLVDGDGWHRRKALNSSNLMSIQDDGDGSSQEDADGDGASFKNSVIDNDQLFQEGVCLDNLYYGMSEHDDLGRGVLASRYLPEGSVIAPIPVLPIPRQELRYLRSKEWKKAKSHRRKLLLMKNDDHTMTESEMEDMILPPAMKWRQQLLLNYCFGHSNSSVLLFPYGHVNFVNHAPYDGIHLHDGYNSEGPVANVGLRWSDKLTQKDEAGADLRTLTPRQLWERPSPEGLVLEMVALRDIHPEEEVLLDYGSVWQQALKTHQQQWFQDATNRKGAQDDDYSPAYIMEDVVSNLRTAEEQLQYPYPDNIFTACFYRYSAADDGMKKTSQPQSTSTKKQTEAIPWKISSGLFEMIHLRPCKVISREPAVNRFSAQPDQQNGPPKGKMFYTAIVQNRPGLPENERIPKGEKYIVSGIPREAFRFVDRPYTSDVHLDGAFRQNIGLEEAHIFPEKWLDLD